MWDSSKRNANEMENKTSRTATTATTTTNWDDDSYLLLFFVHFLFMQIVGEGVVTVGCPQSKLRLILYD